MFVALLCAQVVGQQRQLRQLGSAWFMRPEVGEVQGVVGARTVVKDSH